MSTTKTRSRRKSRLVTSLPSYERWQKPGADVSIVVTAEQVAAALQKLVGRNREWQTPLDVATVMLLRLERMRTISNERAAAVVEALSRGEQYLALAEANVICDWTDSYSNSKHGICVTRDLAEYGIEQVR